MSADDATTLRILRLAKQGEGVAEHEGRSVFVAGAFPGDLARVSLRTDGKVLRGELLEVTEPSPSRRAAVCPIQTRCGGCDWMVLAEQAQRDAKAQIVLSTLQHVGRIDPATLTVRPPTVSPRALGYRRRAVFHFAEESGRKQLGFFERGSHHRLGVEKCVALVPELNEVLAPLSEALAPVAKDVETVTLLAEEGKVAFAVQLSSLCKPRHEQAVEEALRRSRARGAVLTPSEGSARLYGKPALRGRAPLAPHVPLYLRPDGFAQANAESNEALVAAAVNALALREGDRVLELYSGNGNFTFALAGLAREVVAVEASPVGLECAQRSIREVGLSHVHLVQGDALDETKKMGKRAEKFDAVLLDPPRTGAPGIGALLKGVRAERVVYVACDPAALARDAAALRDHGFEPRVLQLVDLFPQTHHVEAVLSFESIER